MRRKRKKCAVAILVSLVCIAVTGVLSWRTTYWDGEIGERKWSIYVQDARGNPVTDANLTVLSRTGKPLSYDPLGPGRFLFDDYTSPGSLGADGNGLIRLRVSHRAPFGGTSHQLFWIWEFGDDPQAGPASLAVRISAPGHKDATISVAELLDKDRMTVKLGAKQ